MHDAQRALYRLSNGIVARSNDLISIWPLELLRRPSSESARATPNIFVIGDWMIGSDDIVADISDPEAPIRLRHAQDILAPSFHASVEALMRLDAY